MYCVATADADILLSGRIIVISVAGGRESIHNVSIHRRNVRGVRGGRMRVLMASGHPIYRDYQLKKLLARKTYKLADAVLLVRFVASPQKGKFA